MVRGILIPAAEQRDPELRSFAMLEDYQAAVGGWIEAVDVPGLGVTMYVNEMGLIRGLPFNRRATFLWWYHLPSVRNQARLAGDAILVGWPDPEGNNTDAPREVERHVLGGGFHRVQLRDEGMEEWRDDLAPGQP
ncbi:DUF3846 domain-containing protein [Microbacterium sp. cx-55]|uniref:DUF3846 domain-containing protein n=1 Tax=Microbacterium sp. cx-55 TaxID=2875948 RepID=UPI001CBCE764|nr:DUF3846 domain-containing protein [Microbacterium sp. cx-55]MBZ4488089.1 DUF3846 domain-containing protein [Microbacterium sp. cx-55]UGB34502.1 DUF3846 domain-containing protein [Microbacterium sp. cx-55]